MDLRIVISMNNSLQTVPSQQLKRYNKYWLVFWWNDFTKLAQILMRDKF